MPVKALDPFTHANQTQTMTAYLRLYADAVVPDNQADMGIGYAI